MKFSGFIKFLIGTFLGLTLAALVAFNALLVWVATGPRSLERFTPYIERSLAGESKVQVKINQTWLIWDGWQHPLDIRLKEVSLLTKEGRVFSTFPEISLGLDVLALPFGQVLPTSLAVTKPIISIRQNADKTLDFGGGDGKEEVNTTADTLAVLIESLINPHSKSTLRKLRSIELLGANVSIGNETNGVIVSAPEATFIVRKESATQIKAILRSTLYYGEQQSIVNSQFAYNKRTKRVEGVLEAGKLQVAELSRLLTDNPALKALQFPVSGRVGFAVNEGGKLEAVKFVVDGGRGKIVHERLDGAIPINRLRITGSADKGLTNAIIDRADIDFAGSLFTGKGSVTQHEAGLGITGEASLSDVATDQARIFWPLGLAPLSREWVTKNIRDGGITKASVVVNIKPGDLDLPLLPKEAVDAKIELKDAKIRYLSDHPEVRGVNALIKVDGISLDAAVTSAIAFTDSKLSGGRVFIADLNPDNPLIELTMHADAAATDIVTLLGLPMLEHAKHLNLDAKKVSGRAVGDAKLGFYFFAKDESGADTPLTYDIKAKLDKVTTPAFLDRFDIENANGDLVVNEKIIEYTGSANVNGAKLSAGKVRYAFTPENGIDTTIHATGGVNDEIFKRFGVQLPIEIKELVNVVFDASLSTQKSATSLPTFSLKGEGISASGSAMLTEGGKDIDWLKMDKAQYGRTNLNVLEYEGMEGGYHLRMKGESLDMNQIFEKKGDGFSFEKFPAIDLDMDVATLHGAHGQDIKNVKGQLQCTPARCTKADIRGATGDKKIAFTITPDGKGRKMGVSAEDAGAMLRALDITETMEGGVLSISGKFDAIDAGILRGTLHIEDYTLKNAPILARMLSLASLTGFFDTLSGNGISFRKLNAPFTLQDDVITLEKARTYGPAIGLTADGTITFPATGLKIEGTIVPSYTLNNVVGKVPLLGNILMGGEGQGVFAARYNLKGDVDNPDVMVNPLSILTPGFLRNLFDAF